MVGNSFTFYYNLPMTIEQFAKSRQLDWRVEQSTASGATLKQHWNSDKGLKTTKKIQRKKYTRLIFQEHSSYPLIALDSTAKYLNKLYSKTTPKSQKYLYATWSYPKILKDPNAAPPKSVAIENALQAIKPSETVELLPVGRAFDLFRSRFPEQTLFTSDTKHPNSIGSYLAACVIFGKISGKSTLGLLRRFSSKNVKGKEIYYFIVEKKMAKQCQEIADEVLFGKN